MPDDGDHSCQKQFGFLLNYVGKIEAKVESTDLILYQHKTGIV